jgi:hypothetical protein
MKNTENYLTEMADVYTRMAIGEHIHAPLNMIFRGVDETHAAGVFQFQAPPALIKKLTAGADLHRHHVLWIGDAFFRPKIVTQSQHLTGTGIAGIFTTGFVHVEDWVQHGKLLRGEAPTPIPWNKKKYAPE